ncbi:MAG: hypothetical protein K2M27_05725 [Muribaculaceae bacterium]|nr:hypothetical protein [Muribaculaceae bacterium]
MNIIKIYIYAILASLMVLCGCQDSKEKFKGTWLIENYTESESVKSGSEWTLWLDIPNSNVCQGGYENVIGVIKSSTEDAMGGGTTFACITEADIKGNVANIKYRHTETGEIWKATLTFNPSDSSLSWEKGGLYKMGARSRMEKPATDADMVWYLEPDKTTFKKVSHKANYKDLDDYSIILKMEGRTYYREKIAMPDSIGDYITEHQLRCLFDTDVDTKITDLNGQSIWDEDYMANITDAWMLPDKSGMMCIAWSGGTAFQELTLYRVGADNSLEKIDHVEGGGTNPTAGFSGEDLKLIEDQIVYSTPEITRKGESVRVFDPEKNEARYYDLSGNRR